jgi:hypothetical protein
MITDTAPQAVDFFALALTEPPAVSRRPARRRRWATLTAVAAALGALAWAAAVWAPLHRQLMLSVSQRPTPYTEMYFTDFAGLPPTIRPDVVYQVPFTLVAHDGASHQVPVTAMLDAGAQSRTLGREVVQIGSSGTAQATFSVEVPRAEVTYTLVISLSSGQSIQWRVAAI